MWVRRPAVGVSRSVRLGVRAAVAALPLVAVLCVAFLLRIAFLTTVGYNSDEAVYAGQGAAIAQVPELTEIFPVFRAHPLLFQFVLGLAYLGLGVSDGVGRGLSVAVGVATVFVVYRLGRRLYGGRAGLVAALIVAVMPYHVVVTRQVLLDGPMVLFATVTLYMLTRFAEVQRPAWLLGAASGLGLTFLSKEIGFIMTGAVYAFLALSPRIRVRVRDIVLSLVVLLAVMAPFPLSVVLAGGGGGGKTSQYLVWQLFRRPNHGWDFYPTVVPSAIGLTVLIAAAAGLWWLRRENGWRERLLLVWIVVPVVFFQVWPTKGFQYLLPIAPPVALLAARALVHVGRRASPSEGRPTIDDLPDRAFRRAPARRMGVRASTRTALVILTVVPLAASSWARVAPSESATFLAGSGGVPGGREVGLWIAENVPDGATFLTIGPSMANIVKYYARQRAFGLSVSPNPLHRNPSYEPVDNPDYQLRIGEIQYLVWDSFSAGRSDFFSERLLRYVERFHGRAVHTETVSVRGPTGATVETPVIIVYEVHP